MTTPEPQSSSATCQVVYTVVYQVQIWLLLSSLIRALTTSLLYNHHMPIPYWPLSSLLLEECVSCTLTDDTLASALQPHLVALYCSLLLSSDHLLFIDAEKLVVFVALHGSVFHTHLMQSLCRTMAKMVPLLFISVPWNQCCFI